METNIQFEKNNIVFNYRVAIIVKNNDKILVQKDTRVPYYTLLGGRCELDESSIQTAIRELKEETGLDATFVRGIGMIENFFTSSFNDKKYHEILIIHELKFNDSKIYEKDIINNIEDHKKDFLTYTWLTLKELKESNFKPSVILNIIDGKEFQHLINRD